MGRRVAAALVLLMLTPACGKTDAAPPIVWYDLERGEAIARKQGKPALLFVHADWSIADRMLQNETFPAPEVRLAMRDFVAIDVDATDEEAPGLQSTEGRFRVVGVPTIIAIDDFDRYPTANEPYGNRVDLFRASEFLQAHVLAEGLRSAKAKFDRRAPPPK